MSAPHPELGPSAPGRLVQVAGSAVALSVLTLGECRLLDRLLFVDPEQYGFVLSSVSGVLAGRPPFPGWQQRFLGPWAVAALDAVTRDRLTSLQLFTWLLLGAANVLLFLLLRRKLGSAVASLLGVACFGLCRLLLTYKLEYPWDGFDILLFIFFGDGVSRRFTLARFAPLLVLGTLNHETALFMPLWYVLGPLEDQRPFRRQLANWAIALAIGAGMATCIWLLRTRFYLGSAEFANPVASRPLPVVANEWHVAHNIRQFMLEDWRNDRRFISSSLLVTLLALTRLALGGRQVRAAIWSLCVIASVFAFGYVNETRLYLMLLSFWFSYAWQAKIETETGRAPRLIA